MYTSLPVCSVILYKGVTEVQAGIQSNDCYYTIPPPGTETGLMLD